MMPSKRPPPASSDAKNDAKRLRSLASQQTDALSARQSDAAVERSNSELGHDVETAVAVTKQAMQYVHGAVYKLRERMQHLQQLLPKSLSDRQQACADLMHDYREACQNVYEDCSDRTLQSVADSGIELRTKLCDALNQLREAHGIEQAQEENRDACPSQDYLENRQERYKEILELDSWYHEVLGSLERLKTLGARVPEPIFPASLSSFVAKENKKIAAERKANAASEYRLFGGRSSSGSDGVMSHPHASK